MKWEGLGLQQCAPAPHHAAVVPLALAAEAEGAEVGAEAAVMEGQEKSLSEAEICRELPQELPRAVQEQQEHGGLGGIRDGVASPPPKQGPNSCHPAGMGMGGLTSSRGVSRQSSPSRCGKGCPAATHSRCTRLWKPGRERAWGSPRSCTREARRQFRSRSEGSGGARW